MKPRLSLVAAALFGAVAGATAIYQSHGNRAHNAYAQALPTHQTPPARDGGVVVQLCDGVTATEVKGLKPGEQMTHAQALAVTGKLMDEWQRKHPDQHWVMAQAETTTAAPAGAPSAGPTHETDAFVDYGNKVFHSASLLGSTIGVSCDMCHPNAANTHPETYPKYQVQLQRVALLRDMIDWCIENPVKGHTLSSDDPKMRALEAYILAQRKGTALAYGKH